VRFFLNGSGFFDLRDHRRGEGEGEERWLRVPCKKNDLVFVPAGIYHRFKPDEEMFFHVLRFFVGDPVWTAFNRGDAATNERPARQAYLKTLE
jgi:1,2-dihydroxy-3-keto-5-methylthiopentene dioxygenase